MGYTPVFDSVFQGSLCGKYPETAAWLFLLALADKNGHVDKSPNYIAAVTGMPVDDLLKCIEEFCKPDERSRTTDSDGKRLELIDPSRPWGWRIINHGKYREKARKAAYDAARTASGEDAARKREERGHKNSPDVSRAVPLSDADSNADTNKEEAAAIRIPECPQDMNVASEHRAFCQWCGDKGKSPTELRWRSWVLKAKQSGRYEKRRVPPPEEAPPPDVDEAFRKRSLKDEWKRKSA